MSNAIDTKPILLFDEYCNLCNNSVQFVLKHEKKPDLYFSSLQSDKGIELLKRHHINSLEVDSLILIQNNIVYAKSSAALRLTPYLKGLYPLLYALLIVPPFIRNAVYDYVARNRYKWFGKSNSCMMPDKDLVKRFL
jgi:predicted DCC family thiol-disulfide oxidoreductase YuxK